MAEQSFEKHARSVPPYHFVALPLLLVCVVYFGSQAVRSFSVPALMMVALSVGLFVSAVYARVFALGVQDRVIRLEERLRMERVLPEELRGRSDEITTDQLIGLRFAPDDELAGLTRRVLEGELTDRKSIKRAVTRWRADHQRI
jgi:hypothetical protein